MHQLLSFPLLLPGALFFLVFLSSIQVVSSNAVNRSIDDTLGDSVTGQRPLFLPSTAGVWEDNTCKGCALQPPTSSAFEGTYTAATYNPGLQNISITFEFTGTAVYIFFILANDPAPGITATTAANFTLNGTTVGSFVHSPNSSLSAPAFQFNESALAFSKTGLKNATHQMVISTSGISQDIFVNFDYALYTFEQAVTVATTPSSSSSTVSATSSTTSSPSLPDSSGSSSPPIGAIVGGIVGGLVLLSGIVLALFFCYRRRRQKHQVLNNEDLDDGNQAEPLPMEQTIQPFILPTQRQYAPDSHPASGSGSHYQNTEPDTDASRPSFSVYGTEVASETAPSTIPFTEISSDYSQTRQRHNRYTQSSSVIESPLQYQNRSVFTTLPSGQVVMSAGTNRDRRSEAAPKAISGTASALTSTSTFSSTENPDSRFLLGSSASGEASTPPPPLPPPKSPPASTTTGSNPKAELRRIRQQQLQRQMRVINQEIEDLRNEARDRADHEGDNNDWDEGGSGTVTGDFSSSSQAGLISRSSTLRRMRSADTNVDVRQMKDQIRMMSEQIAYLQSQQNSAWAQGLSDEPPPGYS